MGSEKMPLNDDDMQVDFNHPCAGHVKILDHEKGVVESYCPDGTKRTKMAIVGFAASSMHLAPFNDPSWEIVGLNQLYRKIPRADRWLEIHANYLDAVVEGTDHKKWLAEAPIPIYMADRVPGIPNSVRFPIERVMKGHLDYFTSTVAFAVALAIEEGFKEIGLWGIDLIVGDEYFYQKPCAEFWLGVAHGKGITVTLPNTTALCKQSHRYGYESEPKSLIALSELAKRKAGLLDHRHKLMIELANVDGAVQDCQMWGDLADLRMKGGTVTP
jgi:hypothetical protein